MKKLSLLSLGAALIAVPVLAAPGDNRAMGDANADGVLTRVETQAFATQAFAKMDVNKDGKLDAADRAAKRAERQAQMFATLDANKDGNISKAEWTQHSTDRAAKRAERSAAREDRQGKRHAMRGHSGKGGRDGMRGRGMAKADANGDKAISQAEFQTAALARFDRVDANKDGKVTAEERKAARSALRVKDGAAPAK